MAVPTSNGVLSFTVPLRFTNTCRSPFPPHRFQSANVCELNARRILGVRAHLEPTARELRDDELPFVLELDRVVALAAPIADELVEFGAVDIGAGLVERHVA